MLNYPVHERGGYFTHVDSYVWLCEHQTSTQ
jgi:hypothetical protein